MDSRYVDYEDDYDWGYDPTKRLKWLAGFLILALCTVSAAVLLIWPTEVEEDLNFESGIDVIETTLCVQEDECDLSQEELEGLAYAGCLTIEEHKADDRINQVSYENAMGMGLATKVAVGEITEEESLLIGTAYGAVYSVRDLVC